MNRKNLQILAEGLLSKEFAGVQFDMNHYDEISTLISKLRPIFGTGNRIDSLEIDAKNATDCGSVGCAIGWAPYLGIQKIVGETWSDYSERVFDLHTMSDEWDWCFSGQWGEVDNTKKGAAQRIIWLLQYGLPDDHYDQLHGYARQCYEDVEGFCDTYLETQEQIA